MGRRGINILMYFREGESFYYVEIATLASNTSK